MKERLAVVVPTYQEPQLARTVASLQEQLLPPDDIVVVNNYPQQPLDLPASHHYPSRLHIVDEPRKGTGVASSTGFRFAIDELEASIVGRTDADGYPRNDWTELISNHFAHHPQTKLLTGPSMPLRDEHFKATDAWAWPAFWKTYRAAGSALILSRMCMRIAPGHNMAVRSDAYDAVGGFPQTSIDQTDEDLALSFAVFRQFGLKSMHYNRNIQVYTSLRRLRQVGYMGLVRYYLKPDAEYRRRKSGGDVDVR
jgi:glycosyltransferase involved in cell wall biosynthesis